MQHECSYVRDVLPLYLENMVSEETRAFVQEHLAHCPGCAAEYAAMKAGENVEAIGGGVENHLETEAIKSMQSVRKRFLQKGYRIGAVMAAIVIALGVLVYLFPVYRILDIGPMTMGSYYSGAEIAKALSLGSAADRREAQAVLRLADKAFQDIRHTREENEEEYGLLCRYATASDVYAGVEAVDYSLALWSAHLDEEEGWIWVYYSSEAFDCDGNSVCGSWKIPSLWKVERNHTGEWVVVQIREHP